MDLLVHDLELFRQLIKTMRNDYDFDVPTEFCDRSAQEMLDEFLDECPATEDSYINVFGSYYPVLCSIRPTSAKVLFWMAFNSDLDRGRVVIQSKNLKRVISDLGISRSAYFSSIKDLKEHDAIRGYESEYFINPRLMWKGSDKRRRKFMARYPYILNEKPEEMD